MTEVSIWLQVFPTTRRMSCSIATWNEIGVFFFFRLLGNPAACRGHKTDGVSKGEKR